MRRLLPIVAVAALPVACGPLPPPADTARLAPGVFSPLDQDIPATEYAQFAFANPARTRGNPVAGAQAVLAMDYIAGELNTSPRWENIPATTQLQLLQGRAATRQAVGIAPNASSQLVVDSLVAARADLALGNVPAAEAALTNPAFPAGGVQTVATLSNLPYIQAANVATQHAAEDLFAPDNGGNNLHG